MDGVLISKPITSLDCIISVPSPVIIVHISKGCIDASLGGYRVRSGREKFWYASSFESLFNETKSCSKSCTSSSYNNSIKSVIDDCIFFEECVLDYINWTSASLSRCVFPRTENLKLGFERVLIPTLPKNLIMILTSLYFIHQNWVGNFNHNKILSIPIYLTFLNNHFVDRKYN